MQPFIYTASEYTNYEQFFPSFPKSNFNYDFESISKGKFPSSKEYKAQDMFGMIPESPYATRGGKPKKLILSGIDSVDGVDVTAENVFSGRAETLNSSMGYDNTITQTLNSLKECSEFVKIFLNDIKSCAEFNTLPVYNKLNDVTIFVPINDNMGGLRKFFNSEVNPNRRLDYGKRYRAMKIQDLLKSYIIPVPVYPEQFDGGRYRLKTYSPGNNIDLLTVKPGKEKNVVYAKDFDEEETDISLWSGYDFEMSSWGTRRVDGETKENAVNKILNSDGTSSEILEGIQCSNGMIYLISHPIIPGMLFGDNAAKYC